MASAVRMATSAGSPDPIRFRRALVGAKSEVTGVPVSRSYCKESSRMALMRARVERTFTPALVEVACDLSMSSLSLHTSSTRDEVMTQRSFDTVRERESKHETRFRWTWTDGPAYRP